MWESPRPVYPNELYHYGVKGMHWGIRRYQPYPKGYSGSGKYLGKSGGHIGGIPEIKKGFTKKMSEIRKNAIDDYTEEYISEGFSKKDAMKAATEKYDRQMKVLKAAAIGTGAALGATLLYRGGRRLKSELMDETLKRGSTIQTVSENVDRLNRGDSFYAANRNIDKKMYTGLYGKGKYKIDATLGSDIKIASHRNAKKEFDNLYKNDSKFKQYVDDYYKRNRAKDISENYRNWMKDRYKTFDTDVFMEHPSLNSNDRTYARRKFIDALKKKGYGGIKDFNDEHLSGYDTNAKILFTNPENFKQSSRIISDNENFRADLIAKPRNLFNELVLRPENAVALGVTAGGLGATASGYRTDSRWAKKRKKKR